MNRILRTGYLAVLALMPVHALLSVWLISNIGYDAQVSAWKEVLIGGLSLLALGLMLKDKRLAQTIISRRVNQLILAYLGLHLILWLFAKPELDAAVAGLLINLRFLALFVLAQGLIIIYGDKKGQAETRGQKLIRSQAIKITLIGAAVVSIFGALQMTVLPNDFLTHYGYGEETIPAYRTIDQNEEFIRINSTVRGPNPLGLYMVLALPMLLVAFTKWPQAIVSRWQGVDWPKLRSRLPVSIYRLLMILVPVAALLNLYGSHSRSGWLGAGVALSLLIWLSLQADKRKYALMLAGSAAMFASIFIALNWQSDFVQNTILHQDPDGGTSISSTDKHWQAGQNAIEDIADNPLGEGPGSAGPASFYNDEQTKIAENYYLQVGQEVGLIGLVLFVAINLLVASSLWRQRASIWSGVLFVSWVGLSLSALFLHTWAQDEISLIWWGLAGLYYRD